MKNAKIRRFETVDTAETEITPKQLEALTRPVVVELLDKIVVFEDGRVEVCFKYQDAFQEFSDVITVYLANDSLPAEEGGRSYAG